MTYLRGENEADSAWASIRNAIPRTRAWAIFCRPRRTICPRGGGSYAGIMHGGLVATALDSAMVQALFARDIVARTGELRIRYRHSVRLGDATMVRAWLRDSRPPLFVSEAELRQGEVVCAHATAKFMQDTAP